jgi:pimeloyl-ACP methyl ester carboxylesterase
VAEVSDHRAELGGQPVFWRSAPSPSGVPALFLHGVPTSSDIWLPLLPRTGGLAPDLLGFGRSGKRGDLDFSLDGLAAFVEDFLALTATERVRLVVHDWGAAIGLRWAQRAPERVERLVIVDGLPLLPGFRWHRVARAWRTPVLGELTMGATTRWALRRAMPPAVAETAHRHLDQGTQRAILRLYRSTSEDQLARAGSDLHRLTCPALVVWGDDDPYVPARGAEAYADALGGRAEIVHVANAGHWPWFDRTDVVDRISAFLGA